MLPDSPSAPCSRLSPSRVAADQPVIGLITKTDTNPFFVKMKEGAQAAATAKGAKLLSAAGKADGDNAGQVTAIENMIAGGAKTILITPSDSKAIVPAIKKAQAQGRDVHRARQPGRPDGGHRRAVRDRQLQGRRADRPVRQGARMAGKPAKIATLDLFPGHPVGAQRHNGFMSGFGLQARRREEQRAGEGAPRSSASADSFGDQAKGQTAMENCLQKNPDINLVYTINEPAAAGAYQALKAAGKEKGVDDRLGRRRLRRREEREGRRDRRNLAAVPAEDGGDGRRRRRRVREERQEGERATPTPASR